MLLRHLCGAILTLLLATSAVAALPQGHESSSARTTPSVRVAEFQLSSQVASPLKSESFNEIPTAAAAEKSDPLKYSVWVLIGLGPLMWIWLAFFPRIRRK